MPMIPWRPTPSGGKDLEMRLQRIFLSLMILSAIYMAVLPMAKADLLIIDAQKQYQYAQELFDEGQYRRAAEEFDRFVFFFPDDPRQRTAIYKEGESFLRASDGLTALQYLSSLIEHGEMDDLAVEARFLTAECYLSIGDTDHAVAQLQDIISRSADSAIKDRAYARIGWILVDQLNWTGARQAFGHVSNDGRKRHRIDILESSLEQTDQIPYKSPGLAGTLSIVPGGGQFYCGRYQDAATALIVNGGLFWAAYESFDHDLNALGSLLSIVGVGFYAANIYGAVSSAHKFNLNHQKGFAEELKQSVRIQIGPSSSSRNGVLLDKIAMTIHFTF